MGNGISQMPHICTTLILIEPIKSIFIGQLLRSFQFLWRKFVVISQTDFHIIRNQNAQMHSVDALRLADKFTFYAHSNCGWCWRAKSPTKIPFSITSTSWNGQTHVEMIQSLCVKWNRARHTNANGEPKIHNYEFLWPISNRNSNKNWSFLFIRRPMRTFSSLWRTWFWCAIRSSSRLSISVYYRPELMKI